MLLSAPKISTSLLCMDFEKIAQGVKSSTNIAHPKICFASVHLLWYPPSFERSTDFTDLSSDKAAMWLVYAPNFEMTRFIAFSLCATHLDPLARTDFTPASSNLKQSLRSVMMSSSSLHFLGDFSYR